ncbi:peptide N-acetyl-beta-D-glucosaminyl asparaginase amidase A-domain-containing protein [Auriculariales sp. MPI-PUGE-AT-0066]|nr:peptide N-acetyl-beta-D-glucosaminyl asparaginase amidase A-domain-containing protein [Auriculariales sp. MPI-PUGE-AT-0066]
MLKGSLVALALVATAVGQRLVNFAVVQPPAVPKNVKTCTHELFVRNYANSYYDPEIVDYVPYEDCGTPGSWSAITLNWTTTSNGTQYDRLAAVTIGNTEIWRTSTPEPTRVGGIIWTYIKDVSVYSPLFAKPNRIIVDLNNVIDTSIGIDGEYLVTLSITLYSSSLLNPAAKTADLILPLSNYSPDQANYVSIPPALNTTLTFPRNAVKAFVELFASGNSQDEEFWYVNTPNAYISSLPDGTTSPNGPYREVRLLVDGQLAGTALPWAVWFTGAYNPLIWRPIPGTGALDQPRYYVDITPFLGILTDGQPHVLTIDVISAEDSHETNQNWYVSGNVQILLDKTSKPTTGRITKYQVDPYPTSKVTGIVSNNGDVNVTLTASRRLTIEAEITAGSGAKTLVHWSQSLDFINQQSFLEGTYTQLMKQKSSGASISLHNGLPVVSDIFSYPIAVDAWLYKDDSGYDVLFEHTYTRALLPFPYAPETNTDAYQRANGSRWTLPSGSRTGNGTNTNSFKYFDLRGNTYTRDVSVTNNTITYDRVGGTMTWTWPKFVSQPLNSTSQKAARLPAGRIASKFGGGFDHDGTE